MIKMRKILSDEILFCYKHIDQRVLFGSPPQELEFQARVARRNSSHIYFRTETSVFSSPLKRFKFNWTSNIVFPALNKLKFEICET